jgi:heat-inducible transcriptional repressor
LHTSGGRIPTNAGYRYYVERLMAPAPLSTTEASTIRHQFLSVHTEINEWFKLAAAVMASHMHNVGLITAPKLSAARVRHLEILLMRGASALVILVLRDGTVLQDKLVLEEPRPQEDLSAQADRLTTLLQGLTVAEVELRGRVLPQKDAAIASLVVRLMRHKEERAAEMYHTGLADMIRQPEFLSPRPGESSVAMTERLRPVVEFLQGTWAIEQFLGALSPEGDVQVVVGADSFAGLDGYSFVIGRYGGSDDGSGFLGIIGPTRLQYPRAVSLVRYMTNLMTDLMQG